MGGQLVWRKEPEEVRGRLIKDQLQCKTHRGSLCLFLSQPSRYDLLMSVLYRLKDVLTSACFYDSGVFASAKMLVTNIGKANHSSTFDKERYWADLQSISSHALTVTVIAVLKSTVPLFEEVSCQSGSIVSCRISPEAGSRHLASWPRWRETQD